MINELEILAKSYNDKYASPKYDVSHLKYNYEDVVLSAMSIHSEHIAIEFAEWVGKTGYTLSHYAAKGESLFTHESVGIKLFYLFTNEDFHTTKELFQLFMEHKNK